MSTPPGPWRHRRGIGPEPGMSSLRAALRVGEHGGDRATRVRPGQTSSNEGLACVDAVHGDLRNEAIVLVHAASVELDDTIKQQVRRELACAVAVRLPELGSVDVCETHADAAGG